MGAQGSLPDRRRSELWRRLEQVTDPELDEPVTEMGFVERAEIAEDGTVEVDFRLPTYWCSPNFAFLMLDGIRQALEGLSWAPRYAVRLHDHMFAEEVNRGMEAGRSFGDIFGDLAGDQDITAVRQTFLRKAFLRRQEAVLLSLRGAGLPDQAMLSMDLAAFDALRHGGDVGQKQRSRYREALLGRWPQTDPVDKVFRTWEGAAVEPAGLAKHLADLRSVRINMEFNGALCRGLKTTRYKEVDMVEGEPTLVDFILDRVPASPCERRLPTS